MTCNVTFALTSVKMIFWLILEIDNSFFQLICRK